MFPVSTKNIISLSLKQLSVLLHLINQSFLAFGNWYNSINVITVLDSRNIIIMSSLLDALSDMDFQFPLHFSLPPPEAFKLVYTDF